MKLFSTFLLPCLLILSGCSSWPYYKESRLLMGTIVEITCQDRQAIKAGFQEIERIDKIANNFAADSEISRLNRDGELKPGRDLLILVKESLKYYNLSHGAFDITVSPLVDIWKKRIKQAENGKTDFVLPSNLEITDKLHFVSSDKIIIDDKQPLIRFNQPGVAIDLGAIAKGYAVDKAVRRLKGLGVSSAMVNAGGNIYCLGRKNSRPWRIGIQHPRKSQEILFYLDLENQAVATSGDYQQYFTSNGRRYSHIIDPQTGYPVDNGLVSVTIIAKDAVTADALSTTVFVLGKEKGLGLLKKLDGVEARIIKEEDLGNVQYN